MWDNVEYNNEYVNVVYFNGAEVWRKTLSEIIKIYGEYDGDIVYSEEFNNETAAISFIKTNISKFKTLTLEDRTGIITNCSELFYGGSKITYLNLLRFNTENVTNMYRMFRNCSSLTELNLSTFNTKNVTNMYGVFYDCSKLLELDLSSFVTSSVTTFRYMFTNVSKIEKLTGLNFDLSKATTTGYMFQNVQSLPELDLSTFDMSNITETTNMFNYCWLIDKAYGKTQADCDILNASSNKPDNVNFVVK